MKVDKTLSAAVAEVVLQNSEVQSFNENNSREIVKLYKLVRTLETAEQEFLNVNITLPRPILP